MTPEQLDEIEKLAEAATPGPWRAQLSDKGHALWGPLPNGECGSMRIALSSYAAFDRANMVFMGALRDAALPLVKAVREARAALEWQAAMTKALSESQERLVNEVKEARAEVERLRSVLRLLWEEAQDEERCANERAPGCYSHTFSQPCRDAVKAALKEVE